MYKRQVIGRKVGESATIENSFGRVDISEVHKGIRIVGGNSPITVDVYKRQPSSWLSSRQTARAN